MRITFFVLGLMIITISSPSYAGAISKTMANTYFENCIATPSPNMSPQTHEYLCACTSAKMLDTMQLEDIQTMAQQSQEGRNAMNKMLVNVYAPCMNYPAKDLYYNNCINDQNTAQLSDDPEQTCSCLSDSVSEYLSSNGPQIFEDILKRNPNVVDPMAALADDPAFQKFTQSKLLACVL